MSARPARMPGSAAERRTTPNRMTTDAGTVKRSPVDVTPTTIAEVEALADSEIRARLLQRGIHRNVVEDLIRNRDAVGCRWRLIQELCS